jgi:PDZ domain
MPSKSSTASLCLSLVLCAGALPAQQARLFRLNPQAPRAAAQASDEPFDAQHWQSALTQSDLAKRERAFADLAELAERDAAARECETMRGDGELSWTCRMLMREIDGAGRWRRFGLAPQSGFGMRPFDFDHNPFATQGELEELRERMQRMFDDLRGGLAPLPGAPAQPALPGLPGAQGSSRSIQMEQGPDGCKVTVEEEVDGKLEKRSYEAASLEELLDAHPELREKVGLSIAKPNAPGWPERLDRWYLPRARSDGGWLDTWPLVAGGDQGPLRTDILGVIVGAVPAARAQELELGDDVGLLVQRAEPGTIAAVLGIGAGDVLVEINGRAIRSRDDIGAVLRERKRGEEVGVTWYDARGLKRSRTWREGNAEQDAADSRGDGSRPLRAPQQDV